jgi:hypothetical protein
MAMPAGPPAVKKPGVSDWARKHKGLAAGGALGAGAGGYLLYRRNQASSAAADAADTSATTTTGTGSGAPAAYDGGSGGSGGYDQLESQLGTLQTQLSTLTQAKNPPPGVNFYQMAKQLLEKRGSKDPSKQQIERERRRLIRVLGPPPTRRTVPPRERKRRR